MNIETIRPDITTDIQPRSIGSLWLATISVAGFGNWVLFDAKPGINWGLWTGLAAAGLVGFCRHKGRSNRAVFVIGVIGTLFAFGAAITASPLMSALICLSVLVSLAMQMLLATRPDWWRLTPLFALIAPLVAFREAILDSLGRFMEASKLIRSNQARSWMQGLAITLPVLIGFSLLLANADPMFGAWRNFMQDLLTNWDFIPRIVFFVGLLVIVLGAYGYASGAAPPDYSPERPPTRWLGSTERLMLLGGVAALFWVFLAAQLSYLFGNLPASTGSGITFAEYARRGFAELSVVASATAVIILVSERFGRRDERRNAVRWLTYAVIVAVVLLLGSAFHRVLLYEAAYGFTTARLYAQVYMLVVAAAIILLAAEISGDLDTGRLLRRELIVIALLFIGLIYWNHEAWIARRNIERFAVTGELDVAYLARGLSPGAIPTIAVLIESLPEPVELSLRDAVETRYEGSERLFDTRWFEWNLGRTRARTALVKTFSMWQESASAAHSAAPPTRPIGPSRTVAR
jgi:hypothetical protein